eukprot:CAMPEP_0119061472 /NCGR_PEP_ID=MMETSP1178-20130426/5259_1 /TAXON_ID=33656 /ORGANISM="unid sp, Strain CCMP2000" /LENGTH=168 /DNA_ID=CAMNT_0007042679 /DNA_START=102 /DNA_END=608 /DNA_ORIENTATION=+
MQRVREEKERINQLRATLQKDAHAPLPAQSHATARTALRQLEVDGADSMVSDERSANRIRDNALTTQPCAPPQQRDPPQQDVAPKPDATQAGGFRSCTLACATASLGCTLLAFAAWMNGHPLRGLGIFVLALACVIAARGASQLEARAKQHQALHNARPWDLSEAVMF